MVDHFSSKILQFLEQAHLVEFHKKFKLPKEEEWKLFLSIFIPKFKKEAERDCAKLFSEELEKPEFTKVLVQLLMVLDKNSFRKNVKLETKVGAAMI